MNRLTCALCAAALCAATSRADDPRDVRLSWEVGVGARAFSLANNATAATGDLSSVYWNPGALAFMPVREFQLAFDGLNLQSRYALGGSQGAGDPLMRPRLSQAGIVLAVPTKRGGLSFAAAFHNPVIFDDVSGYHLDSTYEGSPWQVQDVYRAFGGLRLWSGAAGVQVAKGIGLGLALSLLTGREDGASDLIAQSNGTPYEEESIHFAKRYVGVDARIGMLVQAGDVVRIGARLGFPRIASFVASEEITGDASSSDDFTGMLYSSFTGAVGLAAALPFLTATIELRGRAPYAMVFPAENIPKSSSARNSRVEAGGGVEAPLVIAPLALRAGYSWAETDLHPYIVKYGEAIGWSDGGMEADGGRHLITGGIAYVVRSVSLEAAYGASLWRLKTPDLLDGLDLHQAYAHHRVAFSFAVRF